MIVAAALFGVTLLAGDSRTVADTQAPPNNAPLGSYLFKTYCATCHGTSARGDGPLASAMTRRPPNLTEIAKRHKGAFPSELIYKVIDGRTKVSGHGGPDMPVWGDAFMRTADSADEASVTHRIKALVDYLASIQAQDAQN
jgi:mono/diheme cytochrome c family protein